MFLAWKNQYYENEQQKAKKKNNNNNEKVNHTLTQWTVRL